LPCNDGPFCCVLSMDLILNDPDNRIKRMNPVAPMITNDRRNTVFLLIITTVYPIQL